MNTGWFECRKSKFTFIYPQTKRWEESKNISGVLEQREQMIMDSYAGMEALTLAQGGGFEERRTRMDLKLEKPDGVLSPSSSSGCF